MNLFQILLFQLLIVWTDVIFLVSTQDTEHSKKYDLFT